jgi:diguanylate cyclase (GGDEF)-like protein
LEPLDSASLPEEPSSPNLLLNLLIAVILGSGIGFGLVYVSRFLKQPNEEFKAINIIDPETGAYNKKYFQKRLRQEMSRISHSNNLLSISLIKIGFNDWALDEITHDEWAEEMKSIKPFFDPYLKDEDILARYEVDTYGILLPDCGEESALKLLKNLRLEISSLKTENSIKQHGMKVHGSIGLVTYVSNNMVTSADEIIGFANFALKNADTSSSGSITRYVISSDGSINEIKEP